MWDIHHLSCQAQSCQAHQHPLPDTQISEVTMTVKWEHKKLSCCVLWSSASGIDVFIICMLDKFIKIIVKITRLDVLLEAGRAGIINTSLAWFKEFDSLQRKSFVTAEASQIFHSDFNLFFISFRIFWSIFLAGTEKRETLRGPFDILHVVCTQQNKSNSRGAPQPRVWWSSSLSAARSRQSRSCPAAQVTIKSGQSLIKYLQTHSYAASESSSIIACHAPTLLSPDPAHIFFFFFSPAWIGVNWVLHFSIIRSEEGM